jgi:hypothetical protein
MKNQCITASLVVGALALSVPALALDATPYGAIRVGTWYTSSTYYNPSANTLHDSDFSLDLQGDSLVGLRVKEGEFSGVAEIGAYNPKARQNGLELRLLFGEWDFGNGKLRVGYAPSSYVYRSEQTYDSDGGFNGYGSLWDGRYAQIKASLNNGFYVTLMKQSTGGFGSNYTTNTGPAWQNTPFNNTATQYAATNTDYDTYLPKTIIGYEGKAGIVAYGGGGAFNMYKVTQTNTDAIAYRDEIYSALGFFHCKVDLAPVELKFHIYGGQNIGNLMGNAGATTGSYFYRDTTNGKTGDAYTYGGWGQIGYVVNEKVKTFAGVSYEMNENYRHNDDRMAAFTNVQYQVAKNFKVVPEFTFLNDLGSVTGTKEPRIYAAGVKWEMSF